jgi:hypothetical protein
VITKDSYTYTIIFLRQDKRLRDLAALLIADDDLLYPAASCAIRSPSRLSAYRGGPSTTVASWTSRAEPAR